MPELPINMNPYAKTFQHTALPISALTGEREDNELYILNTFTQVYCRGSAAKFYAPIFTYWKFVVYELIRKKWFDSSKLELIDTLKHSIDNGLYVYTSVDLKYIPNRTSYMKENYKNDLLVYGYDDESLFILGYDDKQMYVTTKVTYPDFISAFNSEICEHVSLTIFKSRQSYVNKIDVKLNAELITDYVNSTNTSLKHAIYEPINPNINVWGINAFDVLLKRLLTEGVGDIRDFDLLYQHKRLMMDRIKALATVADIGDTAEVYGDVLNKSMIVKNLFVRFNKTQSAECLTSIGGVYRDMRLCEMDTLGYLVGKLS
jgi:hypothetical protein